jgi:hypothetical protein
MQITGAKFQAALERKRQELVEQQEKIKRTEDAGGEEVYLRV